MINNLQGYYRTLLVRLDPMERHVKCQFRAEIIAANIVEKKRIKKCKQTSEQRRSNAIGRWVEPIGTRAAVQGRPFALVRAYAANTHQLLLCIPDRLSGSVRCL